MRCVEDAGTRLSEFGLRFCNLQSKQENSFHERARGEFPKFECRQKGGRDNVHEPEILNKILQYLIHCCLQFETDIHAE